MTNAPFHFYDHSNLTAPADTNVAVPAGGTHTRSLLTKTYTDTLLAGEPFFAFYEGSILYRCSAFGNYTITFSVIHTLSDGTGITSSRMEHRVGWSANPIYVAMSNFNSVTEIPEGTYTPEQLANAEVELQLSISYDTHSVSWSVSTEGEALAATFYQFDPAPPAPTVADDSITLDKLAPGVRDMISDNAPIDPERPTYRPDDSLKTRIDATLLANDWHKGVPGREPLSTMPRSFSSRLEMFKIGQGRLVPCVRVTMYYGVSSRSNQDSDIEALVEELLAILRVVDDCFPELQPNLPVNYNVGSERQPYITISVDCLGAG